MNLKITIGQKSQKKKEKERKFQRTERQKKG